MKLTSILIAMLILLFLSLVIAFITVSSLRPSMIASLSPAYGELNGKNIGSPSQVRDSFMITPSSTLLVYIKYQVNNKTSSVSKESEPLRIIELQNSLKLQITPGNINKPQKTELVIKTQNSSNVVGYESFTLTNFPEQKWVQLVIVREGRRYTVYYNGRIVLSQRTINYPTVSSSQFIVGDSRLTGLFALPRIVPVEYHIQDVRADLKNTSDTRHKPVSPNDKIFPESLSFIPSFGCPNGLFCFQSPQPVFNPLKSWKTPYA
jgi:hypothetical protein